jgi:hypothetical protein
MTTPEGALNPSHIRTPSSSSSKVHGIVGLRMRWTEREREREKPAEPVSTVEREREEREKDAYARSSVNAWAEIWKEE